MLFSKLRFWFVVFVSLGFFSLLNLATNGEAFGATESILWTSAGGSHGKFPGDGYLPRGVIMGTGGNLYFPTFWGGTSNNGTVIELKRPPSGKGKWKESILWNFSDNPDGAWPNAAMIMDSSGNLYGTTGRGGAFGHGTVFELTPPSSSGGKWTEAILWSFGNGTDGAGPDGSLVMDTNGNLFGTTSGGGVYPSAANNFFGGTVFELSPPAAGGGSWTESVLWSFGNGTDGAQPLAGVIMDGSGDLFGTTARGGAYASSTDMGGTVFELNPPSTSGGNWGESILWSFGNGIDGDDPEAGLVMDGNGDLFGTTVGGGAFASSTNPGGTVFELSPPAAGAGSWTESITWSFGNGIDGAQPYAGLIMDPRGDLYGTTFGGGTSGNGGTVFELTPPFSNGAAPFSNGANWTESVLWNFGKGRDAFWPVTGLIMDAAGNLYGNTNFAHGAPSSPPFPGTVFEIHVLGLTAAPAKLNFGKVVAPGTSKAKKVTLTNKNTVGARIASVAATGPFAIAGGADTCSGQTIAPKKTCSFDVEFTPTTVGKVTGGINVIYNGTSPKVSLIGSGIP